MRPPHSFLVLCLCLCLCLCLSVSVSASVAVPQASLQEALYAEWAHYHWVWLNHGAQNQDTLLQLVQGYLSRNISVGCVNVDSEWSTTENSFLVNQKLFPNMTQLIADNHAVGARTIFWATSMMNVDSEFYQEGKDKDYYLNHGKVLKWWHGKGSLLDYTNPAAVTWWHSLMDNILDMGADGFKCDGTDPYIFELIWAEGEDGHVTYREYADAYYRDFFYYSRQVRGPQALIMSRPVDCFPPGTGLVHMALSPRDVVFSGWVGDQDPTFFGLRVALGNMFDSAKKTYVGFGSDTGGYRGGDRTKELFLRWVQLSTFTSLFENGGNNEHRPWMFDQETLDIYRTFVDIHYQLAPFFYSAGNEVYRLDQSIMEPQDLTDNFKMFHDVLVATITENTTTKEVLFPTGGPWVDWWDHSRVFHDLSIAKYTTNGLETYPVFRRQGSIIPMYGHAHPRAEARRDARGALGLLKAPKPEGKNGHVVHNTMVQNSIVASIVRPTAPGGKFRVQDGFEFDCECRGFEMRYTMTEGSQEMVVEITSHPERDAVVEISGLASRPTTVMDMLRQRPLREFPSDISLAASTQGGYIWDPVKGSLYVSTDVSQGLQRGLRLLLQGIVLSAEQPYEDLQHDISARQRATTRTAIMPDPHRLDSLLLENSHTEQ